MEGKITPNRIIRSKLGNSCTLHAVMEKADNVADKINLEEIKLIKASINNKANPVSASINRIPEVKTTISSKPSNILKGTFYGKGNINASFSLPQSRKDIDIYSGPYEVIPKVKNQILNTKDKMLSRNLFIDKIPYYETSNKSGYTVYIGGE